METVSHAELHPQLHTRRGSAEMVTLTQTGGLTPARARRCKHSGMRDGLTKFWSDARADRRGGTHMHTARETRTSSDTATSTLARTPTRAHRTPMPRLPAPAPKSVEGSP